ncbi:site-specific integrase [Cryobacterium sp. MDB2-A-2]|nr:site-specific integrase [Cryobacterium sp. MDB2-A-2]
MVMMAKAWIVDRWQRIDPDTGHKTKSPQHGRGSRWRVDWYEDKADGTKALRSRSFKVKSGIGSAEEYVTSIDNSMRAGIYSSPEDSRRKFRLVADEFLQSKKSIKDSYRYRLERDLKIWVNPKWGGRAIGSITRHEIESWVNDLHTGTAPFEYTRGVVSLSPDGLSPSSIKSIVVLTGSIFKYAMRHNWTTANPVDGVDRPKATKKPMVILGHAEVERLAASAKRLTEDQTDRALVLTLGYVGLRINEALALQVGKLDLDARRATIMQTWSQGATRYLGTPKSGKARTVSLPGFLVAELRPLVEGQPPDAFVFRAVRGGDIHESNWRGRVWAKAIILAGLESKKPTPHDLRHAAASMMIASGADVKVVQLQLGHARATETLDVYAHLWPDRLDVVSDAVELARAVALEASEAAGK